MLDPMAHRDQDVHLKALEHHRLVDWIEYGRYVTRTKTALLATSDHAGPPQPVLADWPVKVRDAHDNLVEDARFIVKYLHVEEKGSNVNVASHLLLDVLEQNIDAAMVISNDSDLAWPVSQARKRVPVATVSPRNKVTAGALQGSPTDGAGRHWWWKIQKQIYQACQLPDPCGNQRKPRGW
ncbi:NYN domain-containing protein [Arachnia propionica]|uniref:NYN domain-containing protein n=1 Tax=Arachnia propionica TaxID=1750 RepID=A0A3P1T8E5_9ACTN|nr:NYN domain-containing protein [Arachnia propionica]RRD05455.1 NYN domain-containing protein [Arachnia propionica]